MWWAGEVGVGGVTHGAHGVVQGGRVHRRHRQVEAVHAVPGLDR